MIFLIFIIVTVISCPVHGSLPTTEHEYPLMHYTKLISEEHFTAGRPLMIMLPLVEEDSTNKQVGHLIEELHTSGRWPILVFNTSYKMNEDMYTDILQHGSYIILISGPCNEWEKYSSGVWQQLLELSVNDKLWLSRNPRGKYILSVMSNCTNLDNTNISRAILNTLWVNKVKNAAILFLKSNKHSGNDLQQNTIDSAQGTYLELHTWHPHENSGRCSPDEGTLPVKVFTVRNTSDIRSRDIFREYIGKNLQGCPLNVHVDIKPRYVYPPKQILYNNSGYQDNYEDGFEIQLIREIGNSLNMTLNIADFSKREHRKDNPTIYAGMHFKEFYTLHYATENTNGYLNIRSYWYTPCAVKHHRWIRFFKIFSVHMWICFALSLVLAVITVSCISIYRHKSHLHESKSYSNIFSVTYNIIAILLSVPVNTQPRSAPLRLFFFCWLCYSVAISTVFQAYLTTFLIEPGYEEPIRTVEQMLISDMKFGFADEYEALFNNVPNSVDSVILNKSVRCPDRRMLFNWAAFYQNMSFVFTNVNAEIYRDIGKLRDQNKRRLLCELEDGGVASSEIVLLVNRGSPLLELINDIIQHMVESGIVSQLNQRYFYEKKILSMPDFIAFNDTYTAFGVRHLQTAFYLLLLGYVSAVVCFFTEIMWHHCRTKWCEPKGISLCYGRNA